MWRHLSDLLCALADGTLDALHFLVIDRRFGSLLKRDIDARELKSLPDFFAKRRRFAKTLCGPRTYFASFSSLCRLRMP